MNAKQRRILVAAALAIAGMMLYPPVYYSVGGYLMHKYGWLFGEGVGRVDVGQLLTQFLAVGVICAIVYYISADKK